MHVIMVVDFSCLLDCKLLVVFIDETIASKKGEEKGQNGMRKIGKKVDGI